MFYCNQLLARKAPLGPIWMAATMRHSKLNRRKLNELNIIRICEEILNPPVPIALRLSGILMGGVVIVYQKKVKLLYDDVNRMLEGINEAWKTKSAPDPTILPKGKKKAKYEAVTLLDKEDMEVEPTMSFQRTTFSNMRLDSIDEAYININPDEDDHLQQEDKHHQESRLTRRDPADKEDITLTGDVNFLIPSTDNRFKRYDRFETIAEEDCATFTQSAYMEVPSPVASPPEQCPQDTSKEDHDRYRDRQTENAEQDTRRPFPTKRKAKGSAPAFVIDTERTIIPGHIFQDWLGSTSDIVGRKKRTWPPRKKVSELIELPPGALISGFDTVTGQVQYPAALLALWRECSNAHLQNDSASRRMSSGEHQEPSSTSARQRPNQKDTSAFPFFDDFLRGDGFQELKLSIEKDMTTHENTQLRDAALLTPGSSGSSAEPGQTPCASSRHDSFQMAVGPELPSIGRVKLKQRTSSNKSFGSLDPVLEDIPLQDPTYEDITLQVTETGIHKLRKISELELTPMMETGPTMKPIPPASQPPDSRITHSIHEHLKMHFDAPGAPRVESLNQLAQGMNRNRAAQLFYQTCVLATSEVLNVEQEMAYGDIIISRGRKM